MEICRVYFIFFISIINLLVIGDMVIISKQNTEIQEKHIKEDEKTNEGEEEKLNESLEEVVDFVNEFVK